MTTSTITTSFTRAISDALLGMAKAPVKIQQIQVSGTSTGNTTTDIYQVPAGFYFILQESDIYIESGGAEDYAQLYYTDSANNIIMQLNVQQGVGLSANVTYTNGIFVNETEKIRLKSGTDNTNKALIIGYLLPVSYFQ